MWKNDFRWLGWRSNRNGPDTGEKKRDTTEIFDKERGEKPLSNDSEQKSGAICTIGYISYYYILLSTSALGITSVSHLAETHIQFSATRCFLKTCVPRPRPRPALSCSLPVGIHATLHYIIVSIYYGPSHTLYKIYNNNCILGLDWQRIFFYLFISYY